MFWGLLRCTAPIALVAVASGVEVPADVPEWQSQGMYGGEGVEHVATNPTHSTLTS